MLAVLARTPRVAERVLTTADTLGAAPAARHLEEEVIATARRRVVVGVVEPHPVGLSREPVWATPADRRARPLVDVLVEHAGSAKRRRARRPLAPIVVESLRPTGRRSYPAIRNPSEPATPSIRKCRAPMTIRTRKDLAMVIRGDRARRLPIGGIRCGCAATGAPTR